MLLLSFQQSLGSAGDIIECSFITPVNRHKYLIFLLHMVIFGELINYFGGMPIEWVSLQAGTDIFSNISILISNLSRRLQK